MISKNLEIMDIFREQQFACFSRESIVTWSYENSPVQPTVYFELMIMIVNIKSIQYKIAFNKKSILYTVNYMIIRKMTMLITHNITPNMVSYLHICVEDFFNRIDFMKHQVKP